MNIVSQQPADSVLLDFIEQLNPNDYVLDLGCGPGVSSAMMREYGLRVDPIDASLEMVKLANRAFDIGARLAVFEDIDVESTYEGIWANFSLLHVSADDLPNILIKLHRALKPEGIFHLGMKIGKGAARDKFNRYYAYYSEDELTEYLTRSGFFVKKVQLGEAQGLAGDIEPWIALTSLCG